MKIILLIVSLSVALQSQAGVQGNKQISVSPVKTVTGYLKWYLKNKEPLDSLSIRILDQKLNNTAAPYKINFGAAEKYLSAIKKSGLVSEKYINSFRVLFAKCDEDLKKYPRHDGPYNKLDYDIVLGVQEEEDITEHIGEIKVISNTTTEKKAVIVLLIRSSRLKLKFTLSKTGTYWLIDSYKPIYLPLKQS